MFIFHGPRDSFLEDETNVHQRPAFAEFLFPILFDVDVDFVSNDLYTEVCVAYLFIYIEKQNTYL